MWRLFRHEAGRAAGPPPWAYVVLFIATQALGHWSVAAFGAVTVWLSNGVMAAALLQLHRRPAIRVIVACVAINLISNAFRGDTALFLWVNAGLNLVEAVLCAVLAKRFCGAALDMRRPVRLLRFLGLAAFPAVMLSALIAVGLMGLVRHIAPVMWLFYLYTYVTVELIGLLLITPALLMLARAHRFAGAAVSRAEAVGLVVLTLGVTAAVFWQEAAPVLFILFPVLIHMSSRVSPQVAAVSMLGVALVSGLATLTGHGPVQMTHLFTEAPLSGLPPMIQRLGVYNLFMLAVVATVLPLSTTTTQRRRMVERLRERTEAAHAARRRAEHADAAKSRFLATMSHEMRTPLNGVVGYADLLASDASVGDGARQRAAQIRSSGEALLTLVEDVLEVAAGDDAVEVAPLRLAEVIDGALGPSIQCALDRGLDLCVDVRPDADVWLAGDARRLRQALHHLIGNAVKFTPTGGVRILADRLDGQVLIAVSDTGQGIAPDRLQRLFGVFEQADDSISRRHEGTGVGLTLVERQARLLGGEVVATSTPSAGSTFTLRLPMSEVELPDAPLVADEGSVIQDMEAPGLRVLVVDDHPANREVARLMLSAAGCDTVEACDGDEAIALARDQAFDLILMDVRMPRVDGLAATRAIRALPGPASAVPILAVTADAMAEDAARCLAAGMDGHLAKPISSRSLYAAMDRVLTAAGERAAA